MHKKITSYLAIFLILFNSVKGHATLADRPSSSSIWATIPMFQDEYGDYIYGPRNRRSSGQELVRSVAGRGGVQDAFYVILGDHELEEAQRHRFKKYKMKKDFPWLSLVDTQRQEFLKANAGVQTITSLMDAKYNGPVRQAVLDLLERYEIVVEYHNAILAKNQKIEDRWNNKEKRLTSFWKKAGNIASLANLGLFVATLSDIIYEKTATPLIWDAIPWSDKYVRIAALLAFSGVPSAIWLLETISSLTLQLARKTFEKTINLEETHRILDELQNNYETLIFLMATFQRRNYEFFRLVEDRKFLSEDPAGPADYYLAIRKAKIDESGHILRNPLNQIIYESISKEEDINPFDVDDHELYKADVPAQYRRADGSLATIHFDALEAYKFSKRRNLRLLESEYFKKTRQTLMHHFDSELHQAVGNSFIFLKDRVCSRMLRDDLSKTEFYDILMELSFQESDSVCQTFLEDFSFRNRVFPSSLEDLYKKIPHVEIFNQKLDFKVVGSLLGSFIFKLQPPHMLQRLGLPAARISFMEASLAGSQRKPTSLEIFMDIFYLTDPARLSLSDGAPQGPTYSLSQLMDKKFSDVMETSILEFQKSYEASLKAHKALEQKQKDEKAYWDKFKTRQSRFMQLVGYARNFAGGNLALATFLDIIRDKYGDPKIWDSIATTDKWIIYTSLLSFTAVPFSLFILQKLSEKSLYFLKKTQQHKYSIAETEKELKELEEGYKKALDIIRNHQAKTKDFFELIDQRKEAFVPHKKLGNYWKAIFKAVAHPSIPGQFMLNAFGNIEYAPVQKEEDIDVEKLDQQDLYRSFPPYSYQEGGEQIHLSFDPLEAYKKSKRSISRKLMQPHFTITRERLMHFFHLGLRSSLRDLFSHVKKRPCTEILGKGASLEDQESFDKIDDFFDMLCHISQGDTDTLCRQFIHLDGPYLEDLPVEIKNLFQALPDASVFHEKLNFQTLGLSVVRHWLQLLPKQDLLNLGYDEKAIDLMKKQFELEQKASPSLPASLHFQLLEQFKPSTSSKTEPTSPEEL